MKRIKSPKIYLTINKQSSLSQLLKSLFISNHIMQQLHFLTPQNKPQLISNNEQNSFRNSFRSSNSKSLIPSQKQSDVEQDGMQKFDKTYFKSKIGKINELKFNKTNPKSKQQQQFSSTIVKAGFKMKNDNDFSLQKIDQKLMKYINNNKATIERQKKNNNLLVPQNYLSNQSKTLIKSPITNQRIKLHLEQQQQRDKMVSSKQKEQHQANIYSSSQPKQLSISQLLQPVSLKKKLNILKKHKQVMEHEFHRRRASLQFEQRNVVRQQKKLSAYKSKFEKIIHLRQQRSLEKMLNAKEIQQHDRQIMEEKYYLRSTVLNTQDNLHSSRLSLQIQKMNIANQTREQKKVFMEEVKEFENHTLSEKKKRCQSVKSSKLRTQQSVEEFNFGKRMTINQRKLQQISQQLSSLQQQKNMYSSFYKEKDENELYRSRIKEKKDQIQKKAKLYKINLMLELNRSDRMKIKNEEENQIIELKNSTTTELYKKKRHTLSTEPDFNLLTTTKNNAIYKRWGNSILSNRLNEETVESRSGEVCQKNQSK